MNTNNYIRQSAQKYHWNKYYSVMRPVSIGTHPKNGLMDFINYDTRTEVSGRMLWAELYYNRELTQKELEDLANHFWNGEKDMWLLGMNVKYKGW